ncbi:MAG: lamin tail domain-containing protein [Tenericutes bacterium]|nr:lamin tail domain-containing protein [Mycoplasmatota bacterium]
MFKKIIRLFLLSTLLLFVVSCGEDTSSTINTYDLPSVLGLTVEETQQAFSEIPVILNVLYEESETIEDGLFVRYGNDLIAGSSVEENVDITLYFSINYPELPELTGITKSEITTILNDLGINFSFKYVTNQDVTEDNFLGYANDDQVGTTYSDNHEVVVNIATTRNVLPDLTGKTDKEIITEMLQLGISFKMEVITDNTVPDKTFSGYGDSLVIGSLVPSTFKVTIYLGYNQTQLPDLSGMIKEEIEEVLTDLNILYTFDYHIDDNFTEDIFFTYKDMSIGDYYDEGSITVTLYKNTFTSNSTSLIISKYVDGGDATSDQAIEIFNATDSDIDLADYYLAIYANGSLNMTYQIQFGAVTLAPGETFVIANSSANANILVKADLTSADLRFDGNDTIQICYSNGTYIDSIYNIGNKDFIMDNEIFVRNSSVVTGTRDYIFSQWNGFIPTYIEIIGTHPIALPEKITINITTRGFDDPLGGMDLVTLSTINDGDTAAFTPGFMGDDRVRFLGVDTPETYPVVQDWGLEGKAFTTLILNSAERIYIQSDPDIGYTGGYGRHLGLVWVDLGTQVLSIDIKASDGVTVMRTETLTGWVLLNYYLVLNGYSYNYYGESTLTFNNRYIVRWFQEAERFASDNGLGVHE